MGLEMAPAERKCDPAPGARNREDAAGCWARRVLSFMTPLMKLGMQRPLVQQDIEPICARDRCEHNHQRFVAHWQKELARGVSTGSVLRTQMRTAGVGTLVSAVALFTVRAVLMFGPVLVLRTLVRHLEGTETISRAAQWACVAVLLLVPSVSVVLELQSTVMMTHAATAMRSSVSVALFVKALRLSPSARATTSTGAIVNMYSTDAKQCDILLQILPIFLLAPLQICVCLYLLSREIGVAVWAGVGFMIGLVPVQGLVFGVFFTQIKKALALTDTRVKLINELLSGIRIIKYYAWERPFESQVEVQRNKELGVLRRIAYGIGIGFSILMGAAPVMQPVVVFAVYTGPMGRHLTASTAFYSIALFGLLRGPLMFLPFGLMNYLQTLAASKRIGDFLSKDEVEDYVATDQELAADVDLRFHDADFSWAAGQQADATVDVSVETESLASEAKSNTAEASEEKANAPEADEPRLTLRSITLDVKRGELLAVCGLVGSGKSSLIAAALGMMEHRGGQIARRKGTTVALAGQVPWIMNASVKDNILFGKPFRKDAYENVLDVCCLRDDLMQLKDADETEIGERGINLSGGQKARISLARAVYSDADIVFLDDPLSAVDANVGVMLFERCILGALATKTCIFVTHHTHVLPRCDRTVVLKEGRIAACGGPAELQAGGIDLIQEADTSENVIAEDAPGGVADAAGGLKSKSKSEKGALVTEEDRATGEVGWEHYHQYVRDGGRLRFSRAIISMLLGRALEVLAAFWVARWALVEEREGPLSNQRQAYFLRVYAFWGLVAIFAYCGRSVSFSEHRLVVAKKLHAQMLRRILRVPVRFFDETPIGRIINRFSADQAVLDTEMSRVIGEGSGTAAVVIGSIVSIIAATRGTAMVILLPLGLFYGRVQRLFRRVTTELTRLESIAKSPVFAGFSEMLVGQDVIRAFGMVGNMLNDHCRAIDSQSLCTVYKLHATQWLRLRLEVQGAITCAFIAFVAVVSSDGFLPAGWVALALSSAFEMTIFLQAAVNCMAQLEGNFSSVERIQVYAKELKEEAPEYSTDVGEWRPKKGAISAREIVLHYGESATAPVVLKGITFSIEGGEKVGIVGRTGAGKSSLMVAMFRIVELSSGSIEIDGVDISRIGLFELRSSLCIIPQDPVVFSRPLRWNLDPFGLYTDDTLWNVLKEVQLFTVVQELPEKLNEPMAESGANLSVGQRQLICIARAVLREPQILLLDEATASIDNETDALIQAKIREQFKTCTVLTIAHRLHTIMDSDRIMALSQGEIAEFDKPSSLLARDGMFSDMAKSAGITASDDGATAPELGVMCLHDGYTFRRLPSTER